MRNTFLALALLWSTAASQTVSYALPEAGTYGCLTTHLRPTVKFNAFLGQMETGSEIDFVPSPLGNLVLEPGGKYRVSGGKERGTYTVNANGTIKFTGYLGRKEFSSRFSAKDGRWEITVHYQSKPGETGLTSYCSRSSPRAQMTVKGSVNPGMTGTLVFTSEGRIYGLDMATGRSTPLAQGVLGYAARSGDLIYQNGAGQLIVATKGGQVALKLDPESSNNGLETFNADFPTRREDLALLPDGKFLVYSADDVIKKYRVIVRTRAGKEVRTFQGYTSAIFTPDGRLLLVGFPEAGGPSGLYLTDKNFANPRRIDPNLDFPNTPGVSPDGKRVAFVQGGKLWVMNLNGTGAKVLPTRNSRMPEVEVYGWPTWSPDGQWIVLTADVDGYSYNGTELLAVPASGDASKLQFVGNSKLDYVHTTSGNRLSWR